MLIAFFLSITVELYIRNTPRSGYSISREYCYEVLKRLTDTVRNKRARHCMRVMICQRHHGNAPTQASKLLQQFLSAGPAAMTFPLTSLPRDVLIVPSHPPPPKKKKKKEQLEGKKRFQDVEEIQQNTTSHLLSISEDDFKGFLEQGNNAGLSALLRNGTVSKTIKLQTGNFCSFFF